MNKHLIFTVFIILNYGLEERKWKENNGTIEFYDDKDEIKKSKSLVVKRYPTQTALYY
jgi:hypothetical protein